MRIVHHRFAEVRAELGEFLHEPKQRPVVDTVYAANELQIVQPGQMCLESAAECERPGHAHAATDDPRGRAFRSGKQLDERRLACAVAAENSQVPTPLQLEADVVQNPMPSSPGGVDLRDFLDTQHQNSTFKLACRCT